MLLDLAEKFRQFKEQETLIDNIGLNSRVLIVDSTNAYIRCFSATPTMNDDGEHVGGVTGFLKSIGMITRQFHPTRVICVFDGKGGSQRRRSLFEGYKDNRKPMNRLNRTYDFQTKEQETNSMRWQLQLLIELLELLPVTVYAVDNIEADDAIAYLSQLVQEKGGKSIIVSTDKDFLQLVGEKCEVYNPIKKKMYNSDVVLSEYGIHPNNFLLCRVVEGDKSDNIPGVNGVAAKTLKKYFPTLSQPEKISVDNLIELSRQIGKSKSCQKIIEAYTSGLLSRNMELMNLEEQNIAGTIKLKILDKFNTSINKLNKYSLTKLCGEFKLLASFGDYDSWIATTWNPLTKSYL